MKWINPGWGLGVALLPGDQGFLRARVTFGPKKHVLGYPVACPIEVETSEPDDLRLLVGMLTDEPDTETCDDVTDGEVAILLDWLMEKDTLARDLIERLRRRN